MTRKKIFTITIFATLLGVYSASVYKLSSNMQIAQEEVIFISPSTSDEDMRKILDVVSVQEFATVPMNIPVPGAACEFSTTDTEVTDDEISVCLSDNEE